MAVICAICGGAHPKWECKHTYAGNPVELKKRTRAQNESDSIIQQALETANIKPLETPKFDRAAYQKSYIRDYMRKKRAKDKDKLK